MENREDKMFSITIEKFNRYLSNSLHIYKEKQHFANLALMDVILQIVDEIATLSHCAGMIYKKENYEEYMNTVEELKKMLHEIVKEL